MKFIYVIATLVYAIAICLTTIGSSLLLSQCAKADGLEQVYINYKQFTPGGTSYLITNNGIPDRSLDKGISIHFDTTFLSYLYWNNIIHAGTDKNSAGSGQFRTVGWNFQLGVRLARWLDFQYEHHSQHILDHNGPNHFPVEDSFGINVYLYRTKGVRESLF